MPRARSKSAPAAEEGPSKAWLDSYADAMTLLLAFFILLYASSIIDEDKFIDFKVGVAQALGQPEPAIDGGLGVLDTGNGVTSLIAAAPVVTEEGDDDELETFDLDQITEVTKANAEDLVAELERRIEEVGAAPYVDVVNDPRGVIIRFDSQVLFRSGEAKVLPDGVIVLERVVEVLAGIDNLLVVEGHTDNIATSGTQWPSNWELSTARATTVLRLLTEVQGLPAVRLSAAGYADTRPRADNSTPEGRAENRRVELVVLVQPFDEQVATLDTDSSSSDDPVIPEGDTSNEPDNIRPDVVGDILDLDPAPIEPEE